MIDQTPHNYRPSPNEIEKIRAAEVMKRRKIRILQVRHLSKIHSSYARRLYNEKLQKRLYKEAQNLRNQQIINDVMLLRKKQRALDCTMESFGGAHQVASTWKDPIVEEEKRQIESRVVEQKRYEEACNDLKLTRAISQREAEMRLQFRETALETERKRAAAIAALPSPQPDPLESHFKQNCTECTLCPREKPKEYHLVIEVDSSKQRNLTSDNIRMKIEKSRCDVSVSRRTEATSVNAENAFAAALAENERAEIERQRAARIADEAALKAQIRDQLALKRAKAMQEYQQLVQQIDSIPTSNAYKLQLSLSDEGCFEHLEERYPCSDLSRLGPGERASLPPLVISVHQTTSFQPLQSSPIPKQPSNEEYPQDCLISMAQIREDSQETDKYVPKSGNIRFATSPEIIELESGRKTASSTSHEPSDYERKKKELDSEVESLDKEIQEIRELYANNLQTKLHGQKIGEKLPSQEHLSEPVLRVLDEQPTMLESTEHRLDEVHFYPISNNGDNEVHQTEPYLLPSSAPNEHSVSVEVQAGEGLKLDTANAEQICESFQSSDSVTLTDSSPSTPSIKNEKDNTFLATETAKPKTIPISDSLRRRAAVLIHRQKERIRSLKEGTILTPPSSGVSSGSSTDFELPPPPSPPQNESESLSMTISLNSHPSSSLYVSTPVDISLTSSDRPVIDNQSRTEQTTRSVSTKQKILQNYLKQLLVPIEGKIAPLASDNSKALFATHSQSNNSFVLSGVSKPPKLPITNLSVIPEEEASQHSNISSVREGVASISLDSSPSDLDNVNTNSSSSRNAELVELDGFELENESSAGLSPLLQGLTHSKSDVVVKISSSGHSPCYFTEVSSLSSKISTATSNREIIHHSRASSLHENESSVTISPISLGPTNSESEPAAKIIYSGQTIGHLTELLSHHTLPNSQSDSELDLSSVSSGPMKRKIAVVKSERNSESRQQTPSSSHSNPSVNHSTPSHRKIAIVKSTTESESGGVQTNAKSDLTNSNSGAYPSANFQLWSYESAVFSGGSNATLKMVKSLTPDAAAGCVIKSPTDLTCTPSPNRNGVWFQSTKYNLQHLGSGDSPQNLANSLETVSTSNASSRPSNQFSNLSSASSTCKESPQFPTQSSNTATTLQILRNELSSELQSGSNRSNQQRHTSGSTLTLLRREDEPLSPISSDLSSLLYSNNSPSTSCKNEPSSEKIISSSVNPTQIQPEVSCEVIPRSSVETESTPNSSSPPSNKSNVLSFASSPRNDLNHLRNSNAATTLEILREDGQSGSDKSSQQRSTSASTLTLLKKHREPSSFLQSDLNNLENSPAATTLSILRDGLSTIDIQSTSDRPSQLQHYTSASTLTLLRRQELSSSLCSNNSNDKEKEESFGKTPPALEIRCQESTQSSGSTLRQLRCESIKSNSYRSTTETNVKCTSSPGCQETKSDNSSTTLENPIFYSLTDFCLSTNAIADSKECKDCEETDCEDEITMTSCSSCDFSVEQGRCHEEDSVACAIKNVLNASLCPLAGRTATRFYSATSCKAIEFSVTPQISSPKGMHTSPTVNMKAATSNKIVTGQFISNTTRKVNGKTVIDVAKEEHINEVKVNATISLRSGAVVKHSIAGSGKGTSEVVPTRTTYDKFPGIQGGEEITTIEKPSNIPETEIFIEGIQNPPNEMNKIGSSEVDIHGKADSFESTFNERIDIENDVSLHPPVKSNDLKMALEKRIGRRELESDVAKFGGKQNEATSNMAQIDSGPLESSISAPVMRKKLPDLIVSSEDVLEQRRKNDPSEEYFKMFNRDETDSKSIHVTLSDIPTSSKLYQNTDGEAKFAEMIGSFESNEKNSEDSSAQFRSENAKHIPGTHVQRPKLFRSKTTSKDSNVSFDDTVRFQDVAKRDREVKPVAERLKAFESKPDSSIKVETHDIVESEQSITSEGSEPKFRSLEDEQLCDLERERSTERDNHITAFSSKEGELSTSETYRGKPTRSTDEYPVDIGTKVSLNFYVGVGSEKSSDNGEKRDQWKIDERNINIMDDQLTSTSSSKKESMAEADGIVNLSESQVALLRKASLKITKSSTPLKPSSIRSPSDLAKANSKTGSKSSFFSRDTSSTKAYESKSQDLSRSLPYIPADMEKHVEDSDGMKRDAPSIPTSGFKSSSSGGAPSKGNRSVSPAKRPTQSVLKSISPRNARFRDLGLEGSKVTEIVSPRTGGITEDSEIESSVQIDKLVTSTSRSKPDSPRDEEKHALNVSSNYKSDQKENPSPVKKPTSPTSKPGSPKDEKRRVLGVSSKYKLDQRGNRSVSPVSKPSFPKERQILDVDMRSSKATTTVSPNIVKAAQTTTASRENKIASVSAKTSRDSVAKPILASKVPISPRRSGVSPRGIPYKRETTDSFEVSPKTNIQSKTVFGKVGSLHSAEAVGTVKPTGYVSNFIKPTGLKSHHGSTPSKKGTLGDFHKSSPIAEISPNAIGKDSAFRNPDKIRSGRSKSPIGTEINYVKTNPSWKNQQTNMRKNIPMDAGLRRKGSKSPSVKSDTLGESVGSESGEAKGEISGISDEENIEKKDSSLIDQVKSDTDALEIKTQQNDFAAEEIENDQDMVPSISGPEATDTKDMKVISNVISDSEERAIESDERANDQSANKDKLRLLKKDKAVISIEKSPRNRPLTEAQRVSKTPSRSPHHYPRSKVRSPFWKKKYHIGGRSHTLPKLIDKDIDVKGEKTTSTSKPMADLPGFLASDTTASLARKEKIIRRLKERELLSSVSAGQSITITPAYILPQREASESSLANWTSGLVEASSTQSLDIICARSEPICNNQRQRLFSVQVEEILSENFPFERFRIKKKPHSIPRTLYH